MNQETNPMLHTLDDAMMRLFSPPQTEAERRARLDMLEDEFLERKAKENQDVQS